MFEACIAKMPLGAISLARHGAAKYPSGKGKSICEPT